ncbi:MAG: epoxyqueuosine reductase [Syntrophaceae bacterium]|nr:epoxyqueuosine reductase [Syntrophaceae bacterium]
MPSKTATLTKELKKFSLSRGADLVGIADLVPARDFILSQGPGWVGQFPRAVSMGIRLNDWIVDSHTPDEPRRQSLYWHHVYEVVTQSLDFLAYDVTRWLAGRGLQALPVPGSTPYDFDRLLGTFSHKLAAHLAGLGWIGKSCLLLTEEFGPRVRFVSVLTDAPLEAGSPIDKPCGRCHACIDACPVKAFTGVEFNPQEGREARFDVFKCSEYRREHPCGLCVSSCPKGKKAAGKPCNP